MIENVALLTIDALRADHLSWDGYHRKTSPQLDAFAESSLCYERAFSASSHTRESVPSLLTGRYPTDAVAADYSLTAETIPAYLPDKFATGAFHSNPYISRAYGFDDGFDMFDDDMYLGTNRFVTLFQRALRKFVLSRGEYYARAEKINRQALNWLDSLASDQSFFLWNHYMDVHGPYNPPGGSPYTDTQLSNPSAQSLYDRINSNTVSQLDQNLAIDMYDGEISYLDSQIGAFLAALEARGLLMETLVIVTADHGDLFGEHGQYGHPRYVYPELTRVPLFIQAPETTAMSVTTPASTIDILPTILDVVDGPTGDLPDTSLLNPDRMNTGTPVFSSATAEGGDQGLHRFAAWNADYGYLLTRKIATGAVTEEIQVTVPEGEVRKEKETDVNEQAAFNSLRAALLTHSETQLGEGIKKENKNINAEVTERLKSLGYK